MRLQLIGALALGMLPSVRAHANEPASAVRLRSGVYQDSDHTTILTEAVAADANVGEHAAVRAGYLVDVTSSASIDVVSAATKRFVERRDEARVGVDGYVGDSVGTIDYVYSHEADYESHRVSGGIALDLADRATTLAIGGGVVLSRIGRADERANAFDESQRIVSLNLRIVQAIDRDTLLSVGYALQRVEGYQASPYRFVAVGSGEVVPETLPTVRTRHALVAQLRRSLSSTLALGLDERLYADDWGLLASTSVVTLAYEPSPEWVVALDYRFHAQRAASLYADDYATLRRFVTTDRELATFVDHFIGPRLVHRVERVGPFASISFDVGAQAFAYRFANVRELPSRDGWVANAGITGVFE